MNQHLLMKNSVRAVQVYVFRIVKQGLGILCKWNIGGDCGTLNIVNHKMRKYVTMA